MKYYLIHKIIARLAKENKCMNILSKYYSIRQTEVLLDNLQYSQLAVSPYHATMYHPQLERLFFSKIGGRFNKQYNCILFSLLKDTIWQFVKKSELQSILNKEIEKTACCHKHYRSLQEYVNYFQNSSHNPWKFFLDAFSWFHTDQNYTFWRDISFSYRKCLTQKIIHLSKEYYEHI